MDINLKLLYYDYYWNLEQGVFERFWATYWNEHSYLASEILLIIIAVYMNLHESLNETNYFSNVYGVFVTPNL